MLKSAQAWGGLPFRTPLAWIAGLASCNLLSHLQSLQDRRSFRSLTTLFKIIYNIVKLGGFCPQIPLAWIIGLTSCNLLSHLQSLQDCRSFCSLTTLFKIIYNIVCFLPDLLPPFLPPSGLRSNISGNRFKIPFAHTNQYN